MYSVVITHKKTETVVAQVRVDLGGLNYSPSAAEYHAEAWRVATDDQLVERDADKDDYAFEIVPVSLHDGFS